MGQGLNQVFFAALENGNAALGEASGETHTCKALSQITHLIKVRVCVSVGDTDRTAQNSTVTKPAPGDAAPQRGPGGAGAAEGDTTHQSPALLPPPPGQQTRGRPGSLSGSLSGSPVRAIPSANRPQAQPQPGPAAVPAQRGSARATRAGGKFSHNELSSSSSAAPNLAPRSTNRSGAPSAAEQSPSEPRAQTTSAPAPNTVLQTPSRLFARSNGCKRQDGDSWDNTGLLF